MLKTMENEEMTNRQKMENLVVKIYQNHKNHKRIERQAYKDVLHQFDGTIDNQLTFSGKYFDKGNEEDSSMEVDLCYKNQPLARIETEHGFINPGSMPFWSDVWGFVLRPDLPKGIADATNIKVITPKWKESFGVCDVTYNANKQGQLTVLHGPDETADSVVAQICNITTRSIDHGDLVKKLSRLNLPSNVAIKNVDVLADSLIDQIYEQNNINVKNTNANHGREMQW